jgi:type IV pilus assembly protein PilE
MMTGYVHPLPDRVMHRMRGITLIELMIVVVIVSILGVIAYPNYREFVSRAKRNEAKAALLKVATNQERFYLQNNAFTCDLTQLSFSAAAAWQTDSGAYTVDITACNAANFTAQAVYNLGGAEAGKCALFTIDGRGTRISNPDGDCWERTR